MAGVTAFAGPPRVTCGEERAHAFAHEKNRSSRMGLTQGGDKGGDVQHLFFKLQRRPTSSGDVVTTLAAQIERVKRIPGNPRREGVELLSGAIHSMDASDHRAAVGARPGVRDARLPVMRGP